MRQKLQLDVIDLDGLFDQIEQSFPLQQANSAHDLLPLFLIMACSLFIIILEYLSERIELVLHGFIKIKVVMFLGDVYLNV